jgi:hypothetical protein
MTLRKDGKRKLPKIHRVTDPELFAVDLAYAKRHPAESYQKLADEAGIDRLTMRERIRRAAGQDGRCRTPGRPERAPAVSRMIRKDGMPRIHCLRRITNPAHFWEDLCYARAGPRRATPRWPPRRASCTRPC